MKATEGLVQLVYMCTFYAQYIQYWYVLCTFYALYWSKYNP